MHAAGQFHAGLGAANLTQTLLRRQAKTPLGQALQ